MHGRKIVDFEWFGTPEELNHPGLPNYLAWYSHLKGDYPLTQDEWEGYQSLFDEKAMNTLDPFSAAT